MARTFEAAAGITAIDTVMGETEGVTSAYLIHADEPAIVETGPTTSVPAVRAGLDALGIAAEDLAHIVVTHIHLDHAGGAGELARHYPRATVWVHERGAAHLVDPAKLEASATRVYGEETMARLFGPIVPLPAGRVRSIDEGDTISFGNRSLEVMYTPGHAGHQVALTDSDTEALFTGDALGVFLSDVRILRPATPPPEYDLELAVNSVERIRDRKPTMLLFSHFGPAPEVDHLCELAMHRLRKWTWHVEEILAAQPDADIDRVTQLLEERTAADFNPRKRDPWLIERYELLSSVRMNAAGIKRYLEKGGASGRPASGGPASGGPASGPEASG
ncbi:MAG: MBL fold metallo-hydrolase [Actinobacteria bacterium]|nr:MBL fold metallo-hydrolase [Actinomycetota bacterium]